MISPNSLHLSNWLPMKKNQLYILLQIGGWMFYAILAFLVLQASNPNTLKLITILFLVFSIGISITHVYRFFIIKLGWTKLNIGALIPRVLFSVMVLSVVFHGLYLMAFALMFQTKPPLDLTNLINWSTLLAMWSIIYFAYQFFERYRQEEIKNLKWEASKNEIELNKLKSQLNPHFIFNSMNSIRALIDDEPVKAKRSVTQLANILRNTLMMGRKKTILFEEEMKVVNDYIGLEKTRYEERLSFSENITDDAYGFQIPPLMIQTLIENGIKHGISTLPEGGKIELRALIKEDSLCIEIENSGALDENKVSETGFGILNTTQRLNLLYGDKAFFDISNTDHHTVLTRVRIPKDLM